jgi:TctA family transporter
MKNLDGMGVVVLLAHLVITLAVLAIYAVGSIQGHADETLKTLLFVIIGYWFGAIGKDQLTKKKDNNG